MNVRKKFAMLAFVIALAMSFCVMASASTPTPDRTKVNKPDSSAENYTPTEWAYDGTELAEVTFEVKITAAENAPVPTTQFTYTLAPSNTATAATGGSAPAELVYFSKDGSDNKVYSEDVAVTAYNAGANPYTRDVTVLFDKTALSARPACGYYRYTLTASNVDSYFTGGASALDLIVYINNSKAPYAAILVPTGTTPDKNDTNEGNKDEYKSASNVKVPGFAYNYASYDVTISNASAGSTVDNTVEFQFNIELTLPYTATTFDTTALPVRYRINNGTLTAFGTQSFTGESTTAKTGSTTLTIKVGETLTIPGLPDGTVVKVRETNGTSYQIESTVNADGSTTTTKIGPNNGYAEDTTSTVFRTDVTIASYVATIAYNNERGNISPTGVVLRYAPYLLTMGAGVTVLPLSRRYKKREEED